MIEYPRYKKVLFRTDFYENSDYALARDCTPFFIEKEPKIILNLSSEVNAGAMYLA